MNRHAKVNISLGLSAVSAIHRIGSYEEQRRLLAEVERLPVNCREIVVLYYTQDVTYAELADRLGIAVATVNQRLAKAKQLLRSRLTEATRGDS